MVIYKLGINLRSFKYRIRSQISATFFSRNKEVENTGISISQFNLHLVNNDLDHALSSTIPLSLSALFLLLPRPRKNHPHQSLARSARRHSTAGGRDVSRQYVSHFDRNTHGIRPADP